MLKAAILLKFYARKEKICSDLEMIFQHLTHVPLSSMAIKEGNEVRKALF